uniref:Disintegrin and metalloproteinase domain-containing protein 20-like n=1 Tax=Oryctolagus cuniculus TaxID=9986 RepID=G1TZ32_RABIT
MAETEVLVHVKITLLMLWLRVVLFLSGWSQIGHCHHHSQQEVVIPLKVTSTEKGMKTPSWLSYSLHIEGQRHIIHMKVKKLLASRHFPVFTYTDEGAPHEDQPFIQDDCHYQGYVEGQPESTVALSSCFGGLRGMLQINDIVYEIKPKRFSVTHEHLIHRLHYNETEFQSTKWQSAEEEIAEQLGFQQSNNPPLRQSNYEGVWTHRWFIELAVIQDYQRFLFRNGNTSLMIQDLLITINEVNSIFAAIDISVSLCGLEIWNTRNLVTLGNMHETLEYFCRWKYTVFDTRMKNDVTHFFMWRNDTRHGESYWGKICLRNGCAIERFLADDEFYEFALAVSHELGHNLNMQHDVDTCICGKPTCLMSEGEILTSAFSNCSISALMDTVQKKPCIRNIPYFIKDLCGNGVVEENEQCDCGTFQMCTQDPCCLTNCTLRPGAACGFGLCCKNCQFRASGEVCREKDNECDLPEWCNGMWHECPEDVYVRNGQTCMETSHCYNNTCLSRDRQCKQIFGNDARNAKELCYRQMNIRGDRFGNCGNDTKSYIACSSTDVMCGRIQCDNVSRIQMLEEHTTLHWINIENSSCWGTDYHFGMTIADIGDVKDGTECDVNSVCLGRKCTPVITPVYICSHEFCHKRGVCNNKDHCHCDSDWDPPTCEKEGSGGSVDSGPPPKRKAKKEWNYLPLLFLIVLLLLLLCLIVLLFHKRKPSEEKEKTEAPPPEGGPGVGAPPQEGQGVAGTPKRGQSVAGTPKRGHSVAATPKRGQSVAATPKRGQSVAATPKRGQSVAATPKRGQSVSATPKEKQSVQDPN